MPMPYSNERSSASSAPRSSRMSSSSSHSPAPMSPGHRYPVSVPQFVPGQSHSSLSYILSNDTQAPAVPMPRSPHSSGFPPTAPTPPKSKQWRKRASNVNFGNTIPSFGHDINTTKNTNSTYNTDANITIPTSADYNYANTNIHNNTGSTSHHTPTQKVIMKKVRSSKSNVPGTSRYWTPSEHKKFMEAVIKYGPKDLRAISQYVGTRNMIQCRTHAQKCFMRLMREAQRITYMVNNSSQAQDNVIRTGEHPSTTTNDQENHVTSTNNKSRYRSSRRAGMPLKTIQKDVYSVPQLCGIPLLCAVTEEMSRSLR